MILNKKQFQYLKNSRDEYSRLDAMKFNDVILIDNDYNKPLLNKKGKIHTFSDCEESERFLRDYYPNATITSEFDYFLHLK